MIIQVLLSSFNGGKYIRDQIDSILAQTQSGVKILVRDDGSTDCTKEILTEYMQKGILNWYEGKNIGPGKSFWKLLQDCDDADYYAFCDQDDVWDSDKIKIAINMLENEKENDSLPLCKNDLNSEKLKSNIGKAEKMSAEIPLLYCCDVRVVDKDLRLVADHMLVQIPTDYPHSLIRNIAPGCTYVFNQAARTLLCRLDPEKHGIGLFDWTAYQIIACFGRVLFDPRSHMNYRQHDHNVIGAVTNIRRERLKKIKNFWSGDKKNSRQQNALRLERVFGKNMTPANREITKAFAYYKIDPRYKWKLLRDRSTYYPGPEYLLFKLLILFNRL